MEISTSRLSSFWGKNLVQKLLLVYAVLMFLHKTDHSDGQQGFLYLLEALTSIILSALNSMYVISVLLTGKFR